MAVALILFTTHFSTATGDIYFYHNDPFGNPVTITDSGGKVVWNDESELNDTYLPPTFEIDKTGLIYDGSRYYDPETGRYLTPDRQVMSPNPYIPKLDDQIKNTNLITTQNREVAKLRNKPTWTALNDPLWWFSLENTFQSRDPNQDINKAFIVDLLNPISIIKSSKRMITHRLHGLL